MMIRTACVTTLGLVVVVPCCCQTSQGDLQTLQALGPRVDLRSGTEPGFRTLAGRLAEIQ